jgi:hypothetical protein
MAYFMQCVNAQQTQICVMKMTYITPFYTDRYDTTTCDLTVRILLRVTQLNIEVIDPCALRNIVSQIAVQALLVNVGTVVLATKVCFLPHTSSSTENTAIFHNDLLIYVRSQSEKNNR